MSKVVRQPGFVVKGNQIENRVPKNFVFNETGADLDFRIESDTVTNAFTLDGATGAIGINRAVLAGRVLAVGGATDIYGETNIVVAGDNSGAFKAYLEGEGAARFQFTNKGDVQWGGGTGAADTTLIRRAANRLQTYGQFYVGPYDTPNHKLDGTNGGVIFNEEGVATGDLRIEGDTDVNLLFADYSTDRVGIGTATPATKLDVNGLIGLKGYTVATLPTGVTGAVAYVTDALAPTFLAAVVGGGAVVTPVFYDGVSWKSF